MKLSELYSNTNDSKYEIPTCNILGCKIAAINMEWLLDFLETNIKSKMGNLFAGHYICVSNVHTTVIAHEDREYMEIQNNSLMTIPDGGPLSSIGRRLGYKNMDRTTGPNLMEEVFKQSVEKGYRHYFYGSTEETLIKMSKNLNRHFPGIQIVGMYSPPFRHLNSMEDDEITNKINQTNPHFIWVGLGAPKQEIWMAAHYGKVNGVMIGVGAGFDYFAGNIKRAPNWMQKCNMEWFYRLLQEPKRLFRRYLVTNTKFIYYLIRHGNYKAN